MIGRSAGGNGTTSAWRVWALVGALAVALAGCGGGGGGGGAPAAAVTLGGAAVKGIAQHALLTARELDASGNPIGIVGTAVTDAQGNYSLALSAAYTGGPLLLTLTDAGNAALPTTVVCDVQGGCGAFGFGDPMPIGGLELTALHPGTSATGGTITMQVTPFTTAIDRASRGLAQSLSLPLDAALIASVSQALGDLLGGIDLATVKPVNLADPAAVAAATDDERAYAYLAAAIAGIGFGQTGYSSSGDPLNAVMGALIATFLGGTAPYDDGGDGNVVSLAEIFTEALAQASLGGDTAVATRLANADAAASGADHDLLPDTDGDGTRDYADACPNDADNDIDSDGICGDVDACPNDPANDADSDGICGDVDVCPDDTDNDSDSDAVCAGSTFNAPATAGNDNCPGDPNSTQVDDDGDGLGNVCDICPADADNDSDGDGICVGTIASPPATGTLDNCPVDANPDQADGDGDGAGDVCDPCPDDATDACAVDTDGDGIFDFQDVCPADPDNDSDGDGVCVGAAFNSPATAGGDNCPTTANPDQADSDENGIGDACDTGQIQVGSVTFDPAESADLSGHPLAPPTNGGPWPFLGYDTTSGGFGMLFSPTVEPVSQVPVTELVVTSGSGAAGVYDLARAIDGAIYVLFAKEVEDDTGDAAQVSPTEPLLFLPASVGTGATWTDPLNNALWSEPDCTAEVMGTNVTSPAGYTGTTRIRYTCPGEVYDHYWRTGQGLLDLTDSVDFRRADVPPVATSPVPTTGTMKLLTAGDTWTYLEMGAEVTPDGRVEPESTYSAINRIVLTGLTITEPGGVRTARVVWMDRVESLPGIGKYAFSGVSYINQSGADRNLHYLGTNGDWVIEPVDGPLIAPGMMAIGTTWGGQYFETFDEGVESNEVEAKETVPTAAGAFEAFRIAYSDTPVPTIPRSWVQMDTDWFSPAVGNYVQSVGSASDDVSNTAFAYAEQLVEYGQVGSNVDTDGDTFPDILDNCPNDPNLTQADGNGNGMGDACDFSDFKPSFNPSLKPGAGGTPGPWRHHR